MQETLTLEARRQILERAIADYSRHGFKVSTRTDTTAQLVRPKQFSCLWASLWFLMVGIGLLFYLFYYMAKSDTVVYLEVDEYGQVHRR